MTSPLPPFPLQQRLSRRTLLRFITHTAGIALLNPIGLAQSAPRAGKPLHHPPTSSAAAHPKHSAALSVLRWNSI